MVLKKYKPKIVAVTGTVGKTSAKEAVAAVLEKEFNVRKSMKSYNSEVGVPLVVLGRENAWFNPFLWLVNIFYGLKILLLKHEYPQWLILELGVERPGDMAKLTSWIKPHIAVITALAEVPVHVEFFPDAESLIKEKAKILKGLTPDDYAILNYDDKLVYGLREKTRAQIISYGFEEGANMLASNYRIILKNGGKIVVPEGISFKVDYRGNSVPMRFFNAFGKHQAYSALAALVVGTAAGFNLIEIAESLTGYQSPPGRLKLLEGVKNTLILDDTYNASPAAMCAALEVFNDLPARRKIAVIGDMLELGRYTIEAHKIIGNKLSEIANFVFVVGPRAKFIAEELKEKGFRNENIFQFSSADEVKKEVEKIMKEGDLVLIKGSQSMRMERVVEEILAHPEKADELLVRQDKMWKNIK